MFVVRVDTKRSDSALQCTLNKGVIMETSEIAYRLLTCVRFGLDNGARFYAMHIIASSFDSYDMDSVSATMNERVTI